MYGVVYCILACSLSPSPPSPLSLLLSSPPLTRHPDYHSRVSFTEVVQSLNYDQRSLLKMDPRDETGTPLSLTLGAPLEHGQEMHKDLQDTYKKWQVELKEWWWNLRTCLEHNQNCVLLIQIYSQTSKGNLCVSCIYSWLQTCCAWHFWSFPYNMPHSLTWQIVD